MATKHIELLDECPLPGCHGDLEPHCNARPGVVGYSNTCDLVRCMKCNTVGTIDGKGWPTGPQTFAELVNVTEALLADLDERVEEMP